MGVDSTMVAETDQGSSMSKKTKKSAVSLPMLPDEIIEKILSHLSVKTLMKFRCVSKSFKSLIADTHFIKTHLTNIKALPKNKPNLYERLPMIDTIDPSSIKSCSLYSIFNNSPNDAVEVEHHSFKKKFCNHIVGSCDGLLLCHCSCQDLLYIINPSTRVFHELPHLGFPIKEKSSTFYGLGYDLENDDYKAVAVFFDDYLSFYDFDFFAFAPLGFDISSVKSSVKVYSLRTNSWRSIGSFGCGIPDVELAMKYVNGCLNWPVWVQGDSEWKWAILSFDLSKETCKELMRPDYENASHSRAISLQVLDGCLSVMYCYSDPAYADVWVMKEYGVIESWVKLFSISYPIELGIMPYYIADSDEVLLHSAFSFVIYNLKDGTFESPLINMSCGWYYDETYIESLVSPIPLEN